MHPLVSDAKRARVLLGWQPTTDSPILAQLMVGANSQDNDLEADAVLQSFMRRRMQVEG